MSIPFGWLKAQPIWPKNAPILTDDGSTVAHIYFRNGALVDTKGNSWTQNGTVPINAGSHLVPPAAGPFTDSNYWTCNAAGLAFAADFTCVVVYISDTEPANEQPVSFGTYASGYNAIWGATHLTGIYINGTLYSDNVAHPTNTLCVSSFGRNGTTGYLKTNLQGARTGAVTAGAGTGPLYVGRYSASTGTPFTGQIVEALFTSTTPTSTTLTTWNTAVHTALRITAW